MRVTSCDLNALCRRSEMPLIYGTEAYIDPRAEKQYF